MKIAIQFSKEEERQALAILLRHSRGMILKDRTWIIDDIAGVELRKAGVRFSEITRETTESVISNEISGERI